MRSRRNATLTLSEGMLIAAIGMLVLACNGLIDTPQVVPRTATATPTAIPATVTATETPSATPSPTPIPVEGVSAEIAYTMPLTVQNVTRTSATLFCELSAPSEGMLLYEPIEGDIRTQQWVALDPGQTRHQIQLNGLISGIRYRAVVGLSGSGNEALQQPGFISEPWGPISFRTEADKEPLRVGVLGDSGFGQPTTFALIEQMAGFELDTVLHTGDVVYNIETNIDPYEAYALKYYAPFAPVLHRMPVYTVPGNHDIEQEAFYEGIPFYYRAFPVFTDPRFPIANTNKLNQWYAVAFGDVQFLMLDTQTFFNETGRAEQTAWLAARLADERFVYSIPVFHVPPFTSGLHPWDGLAVRSEWQPLFEEAGVPLVLSGHDHNYERLVVNETTYIVTGGGTTVLYPEEYRLPESLVFAQRTHFVLLEIYGDRIELQAIASDDEVLDRVAISTRE